MVIAVSPKCSCREAARYYVEGYTRRPERDFAGAAAWVGDDTRVPGVLASHYFRSALQLKGGAVQIAMGEAPGIQDPDLDRGG